ncbi:MAG TPA: transcriptional regulator [Ruminococcaceae bacterium]|nr:transcriptional regulator [Oscillospiraceae bacterium]
MNKDFPRILSLLRKEKGISQKNAAGQLGISQALLSHYEKGIRECGLDFVVRVADFYGVSCDYLLGRSPDRNGAVLSIEDLPEPDAEGKDNVFKGSMLPTLNKKLIENSLNIIFDLLQRVNNRALTTETSRLLSLSVYQVFRFLYAAGPKNPEGMFSIPEKAHSALSSAVQSLTEMQIHEILFEKGGADFLQDRECLELSPEKITETYQRVATSLTNLIRNTELVLERYLA